MAVLPKSHGKPWFDNRRVLSGIVLANRNGLRSRDAPTVDDLSRAIGAAIDTFTPAECANYFAAAGYDAY